MKKNQFNQWLNSEEAFKCAFGNHSNHFCSFVTLIITDEDIPSEYISDSQSNLTLSGYMLESILSTKNISPNTVKNLIITAPIYKIDEGVFSNWAYLETVKLPNTLNNLGPGALMHDSTGVFEGCVNLKNITLPDSLYSIGSCTFKDCSSLTELTIPERVAEIGRRTFENTHNLTKLRVLGGSASLYYIGLLQHEPITFYYLRDFEDSQYVKQILDAITSGELNWTAVPEGYKNVN